MKKTRLFGLIALLAIVCTTFTACDDDDDWGWGPNPPENAFYDDDLDGSWVLTTANGVAVAPGDVNYMTFYEGGHGIYRYYTNGRLMRESFTYFCQRIPNGTQINITYQSGSASTMKYWFTNGDDQLWLQWNTNNGSVVYMYTEVD